MNKVWNSTKQHGQKYACTILGNKSRRMRLDLRFLPSQWVWGWGLSRAALSSLDPPVVGMLLSSSSLGHCSKQGRLSVTSTTPYIAYPDNLRTANIPVHKGKVRQHIPHCTISRSFSTASQTPVTPPLLLSPASLQRGFLLSSSKGC